MSQNILKKNDPEKARQYFADKMAFTTGPVELDHALANNEDVAVIDVRAAKDYAQGHIPGARSLPMEQWESTRGLERDKLNVLYCYSHVCHLAATAAVKFAAKGFSVVEMDGGFKAWNENELEVERKSPSDLPVREAAGRR